MARSAQPVLRPTGAPVDAFLEGLSDRRREEALALIAMMRSLTGEAPALWGPSIIGFGSVHYRYASGREGDMPAAAFSPRKARLTVYIPEGFHAYGDLLDALGPHAIGASCLYLTSLASVDAAVLEALIGASYRYQLAHSAPVGSTAPASSMNDDRPNARGTIDEGAAAKPTTVEEYIARIPPNARPAFDELRALVRAEAGGAAEVLSYGIVGYKPHPKKGARVFVSGWADHVGLYPVPREPEWAEELAPYRRGRGTLWFPLDRELPADLIRRVVRALIVR